MSSQAAEGGKRARLAMARRVPDERAYLYELIQTIGAGPDLQAILRGAVRLVTEATRCHACFIYFLAEGELTLRAASSMYEHLEGKVAIPIGEGLTGWVAKTRRSAFVKEGALEDPRVKRAYFPEMGDEVYQSLVSVPIFARAGDVAGVITLHADAPHEFAREDLDFLEHTASLLAGAVENARLYEEATARVSLMSDISSLSQRIASADSIKSLLVTVAEGLSELVSAERCEIFLREPGDLLRLGVARPAGPSTLLTDTRKLGLESLGAGDRTITAEESSRVTDLLWGEGSAGVPPKVPMVAPLVAAGERLGLICILLPSRMQEARSALDGVAALAAVALRQHRLIEDLREQNQLKDLFQALAKGESDPQDVRDLAERLGMDLETPHLVIHVTGWSQARAPRRREAAEPAPRWTDLAAQVETSLAAGFPGILVDRLEKSLRAILPLGPPLGHPQGAGAYEQVVSSLSTQIGAAERGLSVGVSNICLGARSYVRGFTEAASAAEVGALIRRGPGVAGYDDLGPYRYVLETEDVARDRTQQQLERLVDYDKKRGTQLLDTLEGFLDHRGNVVGTSRALFIHANTLRQRLTRAERVSGIDLERDDWLSLAVATKVVKLRRMREAARGEARGEAHTETQREGGNDG
jgi:GAF domain-containing protein